MTPARHVAVRSGSESDRSKPLSEFMGWHWLLATSVAERQEVILTFSEARLPLRTIPLAAAPHWLQATSATLRIRHALLGGIPTTLSHHELTSPSQILTTSMTRCCARWCQLPRRACKATRESNLRRPRRQACRNRSKHSIKRHPPSHSRSRPRSEVSRLEKALTQFQVRQNGEPYLSKSKLV